MTPASEADHAVAPRRLAAWPAEARCVLGVRHDTTDEGRAVCQASAWTLVASQYGRSPHPDAGAAARRVVHQRRSAASEHVKGQCTAIVDGPGALPTTGLVARQRCALGAVFVEQLTRCCRHEHDLALRVGLDPCRKAA